MKPFIKTISLITASLICLTTPALAIEVKKEQIVNVPITKVWDKIGGWCAIKDWHPVIVDCKEERRGDQLRRTLFLDGGGEVYEVLTGENETSYSYIIESGALPVENYKSTLSVTALDNDKTKITWQGNFTGGKGKTDQEAAEVMGGAYEAGLKAVAKDFAK